MRRLTGTSYGFATLDITKLFLAVVIVADVAFAAARLDGGNLHTSNKHEADVSKRRVVFRSKNIEKEQHGHERQQDDESGLLYPIDSPTRETKSLDGLWDFRLAPFNDPNLGFTEEWFAKPLKLTGEVIPMPVPSSFNDITQDRKIRDHVGFVWYETTFVPPASWSSDKRVVMRFGSVHYFSSVYLNGELLRSHEGGHLPFEADVSSKLAFGATNRLTLAVNNTLSHQTVPQANIVENPNEEYAMQQLAFDFFNYAGIHRPVILYTTPKTWIEDVKVVSVVKNASTGSASVKITVNVKPSNPANSECTVTLTDKEGNVVTTASIPLGSTNSVALNLENARLWWPYLMKDDYGYLYDLKLELKVNGAVQDQYNLPIGIREVKWTSSQLLINDAPVYLRGFGKHEDYPVRGKGMDWPFVVKDFNLLHWVGANSFRTSHYPYSEDIVRMADRYGIMIVDEVPAVALGHFGGHVLDIHKQMTSELIRRDKNNPSVIMWSLGNECKTNLQEAVPHFSAVASLARSMDTTRPVIIVTNQDYDKDLVVGFTDIVAVNRYFGWYVEMGHLELIQKRVIDEYTNWRNTFNKPVFVSEYGAGAVAGLHVDPSMAFTEDYQVDVLQEHFEAYKTLRSRGYFIGEMIWNFADFMTAQEVHRVFGNRKGIFTRDRHPKRAAFVVQQHYLSLAKEIDKFSFKNGTKLHGVPEKVLKHLRADGEL